MNPLTLVKRIKEINSKEAALGISEGASWHVKYKESPYVYVGGLPFDLTEGDLLAIFSQYGEIVDVNLVRHKATGKSRGFAFVAYEDQRSTNLAVDNLNGASVLGRIIRVDHVSDYKKKEEEDEEMEQQKREARGVCRAFQRGDCTRGATCKFSHDEQRCADTGWGAKDDGPKWKHDKHEIPPVKSGRTANFSAHIPVSRDQEEAFNIRSGDKGNRLSRAQDDDEGRKNYSKRSETNLDMRGKWSEKSGKEPNHRDWDRQATENTSGKYESEPKSKEDSERKRKDDRSLRHASERNPRDDPDRKEKSGRHNSEPNHRDWDRMATENMSGKYESEPKSKEDSERRRKEDRFLKHASERNPRDDPDRKEKSGRHNSELNPGEDRDRKRREGSSGRRDYERTQRDQRGGEKRSRHDGDSSSRHHREEDEGQARQTRR